MQKVGGERGWGGEMRGTEGTPCQPSVACMEGGGAGRGRRK